MCNQIFAPMPGFNFRPQHECHQGLSPPDVLKLSERRNPTRAPLSTPTNELAKDRIMLGALDQGIIFLRFGEDGLLRRCGGIVKMNIKTCFIHHDTGT
jgi:hypothetical protein